MTAYADLQQYLRREIDRHQDANSRNLSQAGELSEEQEDLGVALMEQRLIREDVFALLDSLQQLDPENDELLVELALNRIATLERRIAKAATELPVWLRATL
jgi:hypothetical protein